MPVPGSTLIAPTPTFKATQTAKPGVWSPGQPSTSSLTEEGMTKSEETHRSTSKDKIVPVWQPHGHGSNDKQFRSVKMDSVSCIKETKTQTTINKVTTPPPTPSSVVSTPRTPPSAPPSAPPSLERVNSTHEYTFPTKYQPPAPLRGSSSGQVMSSVASQLSPTFTRVSETNHLPRSQSPTITLLQAAREGQIPKGAIYIDHKVSTKNEASTPAMPRVNDALFKVKSTEIRDDCRKVHLEPIQHEGIGPTTPQGVPIGLRTGIKEENKGEWYKKMYKSLHRLGDSSEGRIPYSSSGYMSEPEPDRDDDEFDHHSKTLPIHWPPKSKQVYRPWTPPSAKYSSDVYRNQPRKIEDYQPGYSSLAEREAKLDDDSIGHVSSSSSTIQAALTMRGARSTDSTSGSYSYKDGYESDSTLVYKKHDSGDNASPTQQRAWYRDIQKGGDIPLTGFRRTAPDKLKAMGGEVFVYHTRVKYTNPPPTTKSNTRHTTDRFNPYRTLRSHYSPLPPHRTTSKQHPTLVQFFKSTSPPRRPPLPLSVHLSPHWLPKPYTSESPPLSPMRGRSPSPSPMRGRSPSPSPMRGRSPSPLPMRGRSPSPRPVSPLAPDDRPKVDYNRGRRFTKLKEPDEVSRKRVLEEIEIEKRKKLETGSGSFWKSLTHNQAERMSRGVSPPTYRPTIVGISKKVSDQQSLPSSETGYHSLGEMEHQSHNTQAMVSQVLRSIKSIRRAYEADKVFQKFESKMKSGHTSLRSVERHPKEVTPSMRYPSIESYRVMIPVQPKSDGRLYRSQEIVRSPRSPRPRSISPPNIDYRSYILSILRTLKKSERFLQLHNCYTSLDQIAKLERFLIEMDKMNRKRFGNFRPPTRSASLSELDKLYSELEDAQRKKAFFYRVKTKEQVQWTMEKDRGLRCRDHSVEDLRRIYVDSKRKMWRGQGYDKNGLNRTSRSVSELVDKYSSLENLEQQGIQEEVFTRSSFYRRSVRSVSPTYRQQQRTGFKGQSKHEGNSQRRPRSTSGVERDVTIHPHVPVCWWNNKVASVRQSYEGIILKNREDDGDERAHSLPRSMGFRYQAGTPSTIDYSDSERLSPASIPSNYSGLRPWTYLDVASSWNDLPVKGKHSSMFVQKKYPPPVNYFTPNYLPERSVSTIDLTRANDEISPFGHMHDKAESLSHSSCMSDLGSQDSMIIHDVSKDPRAQASAMNANDEACFKDHQTKVSNFYLSSIKAGDVRKLQGKFESMEGTASKDETWQMIPHSSRSTVKRKTVGESSAASEIPKKRGIMPVKVGDGTVQKLKEKFEEEKLLAKTKDSFLAYKTHSLPRNFSAISGDRSLTRVQIKPSVFHSTKEEREKRDRYNELGVSDFVYSRKSPGDVKTVVQKFESVEDVGRMDSPEDNKLLYISVTSRSTPDITIDLGEVDIPETPQQHQVSRVYLQTSGDRQEKRSVRRSPTGDDKLDRLWKKYVGTSTWPQKESEMTASSLGYDRASLESRSPSPSRKADVRDLQRTYTYSPLICTTPTPMGYAASGDEDDVMDGRTLTPTFTLTPASTRTTSPTKMVDGGIMRRSGSRSPSGRQTQTLRDKRTDLSAYTVPLRLTRSLSSDHAPGVVDLTVLPPVPAPPPKVPLVDVGPESPHRYQESDVNIHYKTPVRSLEKEFIEEDDLRRRQEEMMMQYYEEERRKKYIAGMTDMDNRRHADNYLPSQKSPIPLDRYDNPFDPPTVSPTPRGRTPEPKTVARAKYTFQAQNGKELNLSKGDIVYIVRRIDKNWFEGEHHGVVGMFPVSYVEIIPYNHMRTASPKKMSEGIAKAKFNFHSQSPLELPAIKGEMVVLARRVDRNWYMARIGAREGIVPVSYLDVVREPSELDSSPVSPKPVANPVSHSLIMNGSALSPTTHSQPIYPKKNPQSYQQTPSYTTASKRYLPARSNDNMYHEKKQPMNQSLHIDTHSEPVPYRALYEYRPQNEDELELHEGDTVFVMEKCDDGWFVGSSLRTGYFGTFPGNYVERL